MKTSTDGDGLLGGLKKIYKSRIRLLEQSYSFSTFYSPALTDPYFDCPPMVLLLGQYSVGKTSFIEYLLGRPYPGAHIAPEPTTDKFVAVMAPGGQSSESDVIVPGNVAAITSSLPFAGLASFGTGFLDKFQVARCTRSAAIGNVTLVDSPGMLAGSSGEDRFRTYDYVQAVRWFAEHSDLVLLLFDAHKLDFSDELRRVIREALVGHDDKIRIVLNKADSVSPQELMRVYGALMWSLGKVISSPEVVRVFIGSFRSDGGGGEHLSCLSVPPEVQLLQSEQRDLLCELTEALPKSAALRRANEVIKRARLLRVHCHLLNHLRCQLPFLFGRASKREKLIRELSAQFTAVQRQCSLPAGDFPDYAKFLEVLRQFDFERIPKWSGRAMRELEASLSADLPALLQRREGESGGDKNGGGDGDIVLSSISKGNQDKIFRALADRNSTVAVAQARELFSSEIPGAAVEIDRALKTADADNDGRLTFGEFATALHIISPPASNNDNSNSNK